MAYFPLRNRVYFERLHRAVRVPISAWPRVSPEWQGHLARSKPGGIRWVAICFALTAAATFAVGAVWASLSFKGRR
jgi:hypothetical protein